MYQEILEFLLGKKKKCLTKKEADEFVRLLAKCIGIEEEYSNSSA